MYAHLFPPSYICHSPQACRLLDLNPDDHHRREFPLYLSGQRTLPRTRPWAHNYGGHQFGIYAGQLGDGRCISLGEIVNQRGERWELQLKGAGRTPYSRFGDGLAGLRSSLREFLASEYMAALGIPTTRALSVVATHLPVYRSDPDQPEVSAVLARLAGSWVRFGHFELVHYRNEKELVKRLADHVIKHHFAELLPKANVNAAVGAGTAAVDVKLNKYARFFQEVIRRTADLVAHWQSVGFVHGCLNTDNMSILGLTLDYGPFGFLDAYDPFCTINASDHASRYSFEQQPKIALWNLSKLGRTLAQLIVPPPASDNSSRSGKRPVYRVQTSLVGEHVVKGEEVVRELLKEFEGRFVETWAALMGKKLGLTTPLDTDLPTLINPLLELLSDTQADYTLFFRSLCSFPCDEAGNTDETTNRRHPNTSTDSLASTSSGRASTSTYDEDDFPPVDEVVAAWRDWAGSYRARLLSQLPPGGDGSEDAVKRADETRHAAMRKVTPMYALRGYILDEVAEKVIAAVKPDPTNINPTPAQTSHPQQRVRSASISGSIPLSAAELGVGREVERCMRVLVGDVWGDVAEGKGGWKGEEDREVAGRWRGEPPLVSLDLAFTCVFLVIDCSLMLAFAFSFSRR
ncbi:uncharacterized protein EV422DRAFT_501346 [Fimicolochytrium jonesii]|uniref:uncharacterized protein n=1 Tax=Fimicolochytrium jonesii TaxID=1396493 RepID=UPI0022FE3FA8|nr:uncharacterized protein EV422DRAFT_501346 [Fimicolochytrium jonesii]KAI8816322.1 hypothetical protein EV422DRAFT_501346 [Fimicolochytrium jonesii]